MLTVLPFPEELAIGLYPASSFNDQSDAFFWKTHFASYEV
jgi:hypothetical protein